MASGLKSLRRVEDLAEDLGAHMRKPVFAGLSRGLVRPLSWFPAAMLALMGCPHASLVPLPPEQYPPSDEVVARCDVDDDGYEDALFKAPDNCGSAGCWHRKPPVLPR
jgi:hypothetical protein